MRIKEQEWNKTHKKSGKVRPYWKIMKVKEVNTFTRMKALIKFKIVP